MRTGGGKAKGSKFERDVCRDLSLWISRGERDDVFWRSAMSGGRATIGLKFDEQRKAQTGDISPIAALGERLLDHFYIECKSYSNLNIIVGLIKGTGRLHKFWHDTKTRAARHNKSPFMIVHENNLPTLCLIHSKALSMFSLDDDHAVAIVPGWECHIVLFDVFLREAAIPSLLSRFNADRVRLRGVANVKPVVRHPDIPTTTRSRRT